MGDGWLVYWLMLAGAMAIFGAWVATQKDRSPAEGFIVGLLFGPLGVLVEAMLPPIRAEHRREIEEAAGSRRRPEEVAGGQYQGRRGKPLRPVDE